MADVARPLRVTRRNLQASNLQKENATTKDMVRKAAPLLHVRSTLGEISNKSTAQTITLGKGGVVLGQKASGISSMKENAQIGKSKSSAVGKVANVSGEQKVGLSARDKSAPPKAGVLRRITNIIINPAQGTTAAITKPRVSSITSASAAPRLSVRPRPTLLQTKAREEVKQDAPKLKLAPAAVKPAPEVAAFTNEQIEKMEQVDVRDRKDALNAAEYVRDIYHYLRDLEAQYLVPEAYIKQCTYLTYHMRAVLVDWIVVVHRQFKLMPETLYLTVSIFDRYMALAVATPKIKIQLVGVTSLLIAAKYEEIMCPTICDCVYVTDNTYNKKEVADMEMKILSALNFNIGRPLPLHFLRRFTKTSDATYEDHSTAKYFLELQLVRHEMCHIAPSLQAASALCLSLWLNSENETASLEQVWNPTLQYFSSYSFPTVKKIVKSLATIIVKCHASQLTAVRKKYSSKSHAEITQFVTGKLQKISELTQ